MDVRESRLIPETEKIKRVILKKERTGEWFACFVVDIPKADKPDPETINRTNSVRVDIGEPMELEFEDVALPVDRLGLANVGTRSKK